MNASATCIQILSTKSSGSSALQALLCTFANGRHVQHTRHGEYETLYWTKAASVLGLSQVRLPNSEVPIPTESALRDLRTLISQNTSGFALPADNRQLIFEGWRALCMAHAPVYVEKSPHHLHQWCCLRLMIEAAERLREIDFRFIGLVRNPMDVLYSAWTRWRLAPETFQHHWRTAYENLERLREEVGSRLIVVRYEDFSDGSRCASGLLRDLGLDALPGADNFVHGSSRNRLRSDAGYGFQLDGGVMEVAARFGYTAEDLTSHRRLTWPIRRTASRLVQLAIAQPIALLRRRLRPRISKPRN